MDRVTLGKMLILPNGCVFVAAMEGAALVSVGDGGCRAAKEKTENFLGRSGIRS